MSRKDYELIARVLRDHDFGKFYERQARAALANAFADELAATNPRFDRDRFLRACGVES